MRRVDKIKTAVIKSENGIVEKYDPQIITDTMVDLGDTVIPMENELADGFQVSDFFALMGVKQPIKELINEFPEFYQELLENALHVDFTPAITEAKRILLAKYGSLGKFTNLFFNLITAATDDMAFGQSLKDQFVERSQRWKNMFTDLAPSKTA